VSGPLLPRLRRSWYDVRRRIGLNVERPARLAVEKARWLNDASSPVMLMVDDLTNAWHKPDDAADWLPRGDWGGAHDKPGSALRHLEEGLLSEFPEARVTFFTVAGPISAYTTDGPFSRAAAIDADPASRRFFSSLAVDRRFELAYHGYDHGRPAARTEDFVQEWEGFSSREEAVDQTTRGLDIFRRGTGTLPRGGKYGGWKYNDFSDAVVDELGFLWWCRDWMPRDVTGRIVDGYYEPQFFGRNRVVAIPSTIHGHFWGRRQIDVLLERRQVIAIEEHIAAIRPDGLTQTPNIGDDLGQLRELYGYLRGKSVWHATGTDIASYVIAREQTLVHDVTRDQFSIHYAGRVERPLLTLVIQPAHCGRSTTCGIEVTTPAGEHVRGVRCPGGRPRFLVTVPVENGTYAVQAGPRSAADRGE
jgi:peptidoglycan/xylan/chitin deacetylase (PgdA/CDA1 family)